MPPPCHGSPTDIRSQRGSANAQFSHRVSMKNLRSLSLSKLVTLVTLSILATLSTLATLWAPLAAAQGVPGVILDAAGVSAAMGRNALI